MTSQPRVTSIPMIRMAPDPPRSGASALRKPILDANSELRACQELIGNRFPLSEDALADDRVDLRSLQSAAP
jgi:hypothetical protein